MINHSIMVGGKEYMIVCYREPRYDDTWLSVLGTVWHGLNGCGYDGMGGARAILRLVPIRHTFGGVVFEETGEIRVPKSGEWMLDGVGYIPTPLYVVDDDYITLPYMILRPVALASSE